MDLETAVSIVASVLAFFLFTISAFAYRREKRRRRLLFVTAGFFVFAIQEALNAMQEIFFEKKNPALEGYLAILSLVILLLFVVGLIKK
jgi:tryptophan-rich sensory protein